MEKFRFPFFPGMQKLVGYQAGDVAIFPSLLPKSQ